MLASDVGMCGCVGANALRQEEAILAGLDAGRLRLQFEGSKLKGVWSLKRFRENWLFTKERDEFAFASSEDAFKTSALSDWTLDRAQEEWYATYGYRLA
jgi:hypothetical protein